MAIRPLALAAAVAVGFTVAACQPVGPPPPPPAPSPQQPADYFLPSTFLQDNQADADLGSTGPQFVPAGTSTQLFELGKQHTAFLLSASSLGGSNHQTPLAELANACGGVVDGQTAVVGSAVYAPCSSSGVEKITAGAGPPSLTLNWATGGSPGPVTADPAIGAVWYVNKSAKTLNALSAADGSSLTSVSIAGLSASQHFPTPLMTTTSSGKELVMVEEGSQVAAFETGAGGGTLGTAEWTSSALDQIVQSRPAVDSTDGFVVVGTENDSLYGLSLANGTTKWGPSSIGTAEPLGDVRQFSGLGGCGDLDPLGITSNLAYDSSQGSHGTVYAVGERETGGGAPHAPEHVLVGVDPTTGAESLQPKNVDVAGMTEVAAQQQRAGLAVGNGNVYVGYGGLAGDCGTYHGFVVAASESNGTVVGSFEVANTTGNRAGAVWATTAFALDGSGNVYTATGNSLDPPTNTPDYADSVLRFTANLG